MYLWIYFCLFWRLLWSLNIHVFMKCIFVYFQGFYGRFRIFLKSAYKISLALLKVSFLVLLCINLNAAAQPSGSKSADTQTGASFRHPPISWYIVFAPILLMMTCLCINILVYIFRTKTNSPQGGFSRRSINMCCQYSQNTWT